MAGVMVIPNENLHGSKNAGERVAKVIARSGLCSRREAEALIQDKRVSVNGAVIESAALDILPSDAVLVDGKPLSVREPPRLWRYHKPKGRVTTHKDPEGRPTVFEGLPESLPRLISVGRPDFNTEGLLLLTNDGDLARHLELPSTGWTRRYRVRAFGQVTEEQLKELAGGVTINKMGYGPIEASVEREQGGNVWISVSIREGKNREVRRIMEHLGLTVNRLIRVSFGPFMLGDMEPGQIEEVKTAVLKDQLGPRLSRQLGVRREPVREERRLAPTRSKPTYLRRKPAAGARPEAAHRQEAEARPLKRRRIFEEGEAPKVEFVAEKPRKGRFVREGERAGQAGFRSRRSEDDGGREAHRPRFQKRQEDIGKRAGKAPFRTRTGENEGEREGGPPRFQKRPRTEGDFGGDKRQAPAERSGWKPREQLASNEHKEAGAGKTPRFKKFRPEARSDKQRAQGTGAEETPRFKKFRPEARSDKQRPPRRFEASGDGGAGHGKFREEGVGSPQRRREPEGERKPFRTREAPGRTSSRDTAGRPRPKGGGAKPFRGGGKPPRGKHTARSPRPSPRKPDKETP